jgi:GT2 family glycosyltransferase
MEYVERKFESIVGLILNFNSLDDLEHLLIQINTFKIKFKIVVVDNQSDLISIQELRRITSQYSHVVLVELDKNKGYAAGNNAGFKFIDMHYNSSFVLVMNPDIFYDEYCIDKLFLEINTSSDIAIVGPKMLDLSGEVLLSAWKLPSVIDNSIIDISFIHKIFGTPIKYKNLKESQDVEVVQGAMFLARLDILKKVDYFSERTFLYMEESILGQKLKGLNYRLRYLSEAEFTHKVGGSINTKMPGIAKKFRILRDSRHIYHKYYRKNNRIEVFIYDIFSYLGLVEKVILDLFFKMKRF